MHKDLNLILKHFHAALQMGPWRDEMNQIPNDGNTAGSPETMLQALVKTEKCLRDNFRENNSTGANVTCFQNLQWSIQD